MSFLLLLATFSYTQKNSYLSFKPLSKDVLNVVKIDTLKYTLNIYYQEGIVNNVVVTGKIGITTEHEIFFSKQELNFSKKNIHCDITFPSMVLKKSKNIIFLNFEMRNLAFDFYRLKESVNNFDCDFTIDCIKKCLDEIHYFWIPNLTDDSRIVFGSDNLVKTFPKMELEFILNVNDIGKVNLYNENKLVWSVKYTDMAATR